MNPLSNYRHRYRLHQAYSQYPRLNLTVDIAGTLCLAGLVATVAWFGYSMPTYQAAPNTNKLPQTQSTQMAAILSTSQKPLLNTNDVEIPAAATAAGKMDMASGDTNVFSLKNNQKKIHETDWIILLPADKYIIQFASSANRDLLYAEAKAFPTGPVAIYPFKKSSGKKTIYGFSSGVYNTVKEAKRALETLPPSAVSNSPWIRPVGVLKKQIMGLSIES